MKMATWCMVFCLIVFANCQALFYSGQFLPTYVVNDSVAVSASSIVSYDPETDSFTTDILGGAYTNTYSIAFYSLLSTPMGMFASGDFAFVGDEMTYSGGVLQIVDGSYQGLNGGVFNAEAHVYSIAYITDYIVFAGSFHLVQDISLKNFHNPSANSIVPGIVKMDANYNYSLLDDPEQMFNVTNNVLSVAATEDGNTLFMLVEGGVIYSWDAVNNYRVIYEEASLIAPLVVDSFNNLYVVNLTQHTFNSNRIFTLYYFNATESYQTPHPKNLLYTNCKDDEGHPISPWIFSWKNGLMMAIPDPNKCNQAITIFNHFNPVTDKIMPAVISYADLWIFIVVAGSDGDIWLLGSNPTIDPNPLLHYYSDVHNQWYNVHYDDAMQGSIQNIQWDTLNNDLLAVVANLGSHRLTLCTVSATRPPVVTGCSDGGPIGVPGLVECAAAVQTRNPEEPLVVFVTGSFTEVGNGAALSYAARYSNGNWTDFLIGSNYVPTVLAVHGDILFYAYGSMDHYMPYNIPLPLLAMNVTSGEAITFPSLPLMLNSAIVDINAITVDENFVYVGGNLETTLPDGSKANNVLIYNRQTETWSGIGGPGFFFPQAVQTIYSISVNTVNGTKLLAFSGGFTFTDGGYNFYNYAVWNFNESAWYFVPVIIEYYLFDIILLETGNMYIGGVMQIGVTRFYVLSVDIATGAYHTPGTLPAVIEEIGVFGLLVHNDKNGNTYLYAAGLFEVDSPNTVPQSTTVGLIYTNVNGNEPWTVEFTLW